MAERFKYNNSRDSLHPSRLTKNRRIKTEPFKSLTPEQRLEENIRQRRKQADALVKKLAQLPYGEMYDHLNSQLRGIQRWFIENQVPYSTISTSGSGKTQMNLERYPELF